MSARVLVLGAGAGGTMVANRLDRELGGLADIVVLDRTPTHRYQPAFYLSPFGHADLDHHTRDVREYLREDVTFCEATVTGIDPGERTVAVGDGAIDYDRLVVALGHELVAGPWEGEPHVYPFYRPAGARALRETLAGLTAPGERETQTAQATDGGTTTIGADPPLGGLSLRARRLLSGDARRSRRPRLRDRAEGALRRGVGRRVHRARC
ncbi:hypothetical protein BRC71_05900 [Halobacteriales archaeon QH_7_65_31]|nr:MAG: hypothetical protein BRC71_05900 [Halobacteriales archaeon QH_7_65_31]